MTVTEAAAYSKTEAILCVCVCVCVKGPNRLSLDYQFPYLHIQKNHKGMRHSSIPCDLWKSVDLLSSRFWVNATCNTLNHHDRKPVKCKMKLRRKKNPTTPKQSSILIITAQISSCSLCYSNEDSLVWHICVCCGVKMLLSLFHLYFFLCKTYKTVHVTIISGKGMHLEENQICCIFKRNCASG